MLNYTILPQMADVLDLFEIESKMDLGTKLKPALSSLITIKYKYVQEINNKPIINEYLRQTMLQLTKPKIFRNKKMFKF